MASSSDLEKKAKEAFIDDHFQLAVDLLTEAINLDSSKAELFADRAQANLKLNYFPEAVADANKAIELDPAMAKAYFRKGTACMKLEEYETAKAALEIGAALAPEDKRYATLIKECEQKIAEEADNAPQAGNIPSEVPQSAVDTKEDQPMDDNISPEVPQSAIDTKEDQPMNDVPTEAPIVPPAKPKFRHEFYQKPEEVVVTIFAKGVAADNVVIDFGEQILSVTINIPDEEPYHFQPRLFGKIIPSNSKYVVLSTKVEIRLAKAESIHWTSLEYTKEPTVVQRIKSSSEIGVQRPTYPSSKPQKVDWNKLEAEVKKEEKEEKLDGDAALNKFFRDIYQDADEDMRRAMQKSFVESNGTVLSTNWQEVGSKKVEGSPPDGMELKKWEH